MQLTKAPNRRKKKKTERKGPQQFQVFFLFLFFFYSKKTKQNKYRWAPLLQEKPQNCKKIKILNCFTKKF